MEKLHGSMAKSLANTFVLYSKIHSFHWNITGPRFLELHTFFEEVYTFLWKTLDVLAEELRIMDQQAPKNVEELTEGSEITAEKKVPSAEDMLKKCIADCDILMKVYASTADEADKAKDKGTASTMESLIGEIEKIQWKMKSMI